MERGWRKSWYLPRTTFYGIGDTTVARPRPAISAGLPGAARPHPFRGVSRGLEVALYENGFRATRNLSNGRRAGIRPIAGRRVYSRAARLGNLCFDRGR